MSYSSWNDYFLNYYDDRKTSLGYGNLMEDTDAFERGYKNRFGEYLDCHGLKLTKQYGSEKAWDIINRNIQILNEEKRAAIKAASDEYVFHPVPDDVTVPF